MAGVAMASSDLVGYGKWGELSYQEMWDQQPVYCQWTVKKFQELVKEGDELGTKYVEGESRLKRLAQWITETDDLRAAVEPEYECDSDMELVEVEKPESETLAKRCAKLVEHKSAKFYGVALPEDHSGVYASWDECKVHVIGVKGVMYKSFGCAEEAEEYVRNPPPKKGDTPEAKAAKEAAIKAKLDAKAAKTAEAQAAKEAKEEAKADAKAAKAAAKVGGSKKRKSVGQDTPAEKPKVELPEPEPKRQAAAEAGGKPVKSSKSKPSAEDSSAKAKPFISEELLKRAQELGMASALNNLASRPEILSKGLSAEDLLDALVKVDGLVNKAKNLLLSPTPVSDPISPVQDAPMDKFGLHISPSKVEQVKPNTSNPSELAKTLGNLSATLQLVSTPAPEEKAGTQGGLTEAQQQKIKENREAALARKAQVGGN